jgi:hypothetical protein
MASTYLTRTPSSGGNRKTFTISSWFKRSKLGATQILVQSATDGSTRSQITLRSDDMLQFYSENGGVEKINVRTNRVLRDTNAWYNVVLAVDTTQGTASNRVKFYINGVQETSLHTATYGDQDYDTQFNHTVAHTIGRRDAYGDMYFDGLMSHFHLIDGTALAPTVFGSTDSTTGEWKINTSPSYTVGTNGFFVLKDTNSGTDQSANTNNLTVNGTLTKTEDCPSNVFATFNPLNVPTSNAPTFANGNTTSTSSTTNGSYKWGGCTTLGMTSGKFYCEAKATVDNTYSRNVIGITGDSANIARANGSILNGTHSWGYYSENGTVSGNGSGDLSGWNTTYTTGDIIMMALDLSNNKLYFGKNGTWLNSGVPTSGSTGTGAVSIIAANTTNDGVYFFAQTDDTGTDSPSKFEFNFGNGYFGTTAVSSAGTNASGIGIFEYDVPTGYTALSTKGLNL